MDALLARYLDGDLTENEARALLQRLQEDPALAVELRDYERILAGAHRLKRAEAPEGFADAVMDRIASEPALQPPHPAVDPRRSNSRARFVSWRRALAVAAVLILAFVLGRVTVSSSDHAPQLAAPSAQFSQNHSTLKVMEQPRTETASLVSGGGASSAGDFRVVHLIYAPQRDDLKSVTVAGSFNGWDAHSLPMEKVGGVWTTNLVLPPGAYEYMFVEDGKHWVTDPLAPYTRDDGFGNRNAVLQLGA
jgi:anti-sigma-K factor RskA